MRWTVVALDRMPSPRRSTTSSFSHEMSLGVAPAALAATLPFTPLPSM
jgi:hypothetical protein